ncbi:YitT family protein [Ornithinibacillus californiensis]|uniref:YitT family protein n=1 Tax=Ornithinibacillus californiensis TaxID=161536 RepID=UPI00064DFEB9|nr:YitT family protein [Ornithinibacillus californiensis]
MEHTQKRLLKEYLLVALGATLVALSYNVFLLPSKLAAGGISGISTVLFEQFGYSPAMTQFIINIPIFVIGWLVLGKDFGGKTLLGTFWVPMMIGLTSNTPITVTDPFLGALYGGIVLGIGLGIVYIGKGSTGGTASIAQILKKFTGKSSGYTQLVVDGVVVISSLFVFNLELTLFALLAIYICSKTIDFVQLRTSTSKLIVIITEDEEKVQELIRTGIDRGLTKVRSVGGYSNSDKTLILCVAEQPEAVKLKGMLQQEIPTAFVIFLNASEILGRGFSLDKYYGQKL